MRPITGQDAADASWPITGPHRPSCGAEVVRTFRPAGSSASPQALLAAHP